jgi:hypothetical protein
MVEFLARRSFVPRIRRGTVRQLAESGFFYEGKSGNPKKITCFLCHESLDEISADTEAMEEHAESCPDCPRVLLLVHHKKWIATSGKEHHEYAANTEQMIKARLATFERGWPNNEPGWTCTPEKVRHLTFEFRVQGRN